MDTNLNITVVIGTLCMILIMGVAIASQEFSWWVFPFVILFGTICAGILSLCLATYREDKFRKTAQADHPDHPWLWDARWRTDKIPSKSKSEFRGLLAFTTILAMFAVIGIASLIERLLLERNLWALLNVIPIAAAGFFCHKTWHAWQAFRFEKCVTLLLKTRPAWTGKTLIANLTIADRPTAALIDAQLEHWSVARTEDSDGTTFTKYVDKTLPGHVELLVTEDNTSKITIDVPAEVPATAWEAEGPSSWWDLVLTIQSDNKSISMRYEVPVARA